MRKKEEKIAATIYEVADEAKVSVATVSRVINGTAVVSPKTKKRVREAIQKLAFVPNQSAIGLSSRHGNRIAIVTPGLVNMYFSELISGMVDVAELHRLETTIVQTEFTEEMLEETVKSLSARRVSGAVFLSSRIPKKIIDLIQQLKLQVVIAGGLATDDELPNVSIELFDAFKEMANFVKKDYSQEQIALINDKGSEASKWRQKGFKSAVPNGLEININPSYDEGYKAGEIIVEKNVRAIVSFDDLTTVGILNYLQDQNIKVPDQVEIITDDDTLMTKISRPELTSLSYFKYDIGAMAMDMLQKLILGKDIEDIHPKLPFNIIERGSTKKS